jgi:uncharacterized protein (TIGR00369 family)
MTTAEISLSFIRPVTEVGDTLSGRAKAIHVGRSVGLSEGTITDSRGRLIARGSCRMVLSPPLELPEDALETARAVEPLVEPSFDTPDPYLREAVGRVVPQEEWDHLSGLEVLQGLINGELAAPPIANLTGLWPVEVAEGASAWRMPASEWHCSPMRGRLYGGSIAFLAGSAIEGSIATTVPAGTAFATVDLKVYFMRPVRPDGRNLVAKGTVIHRGRQVAVASSEVTDADGRRVAVAMGSAMILHGRPAAVAGQVLVGDAR